MQPDLLILHWGKYYFLRTCNGLSRTRTEAHLCRTRFATGWNYFLKYSVLLANNLTATGLIIRYWREDINVGVWIAVFGALVVGLNVRKAFSFVSRTSL